MAVAAGVLTRFLLLLVPLVDALPLLTVRAPKGCELDRGVIGRLSVLGVTFPLGHRLTGISLLGALKGSGLFLIPAASMLADWAFLISLYSFFL